MRAMIMLFVAVTFLSVTIAYATEMSPGEGEAKALFERKCIQCHGLNWSTERMKTGEGWAATVMRMKNVNKAPISDEEAAIIIDYLSSNYGSSRSMHHHGMKGMEHN